MAEPLAGAERFDVRGAIETIDRATSYDIPLRRRTEGVTWMVWGLVTAVVVLSISVLAELPWWQPAYVPLALFPLVGLAGISAVWRIGALSTPTLAPDPGRVLRAAAAASAAAVALGMLGWFGYAWTGSYALMGGAFVLFTWALVNAAQWSRMTADGRRIAIVAGILLGIGGAIGSASMGHVPTSLDYLLLAGIAGGGPIAVGLYRALTG